jgi:DNA/RNA-binding domain of Phe-tRNA-synthetase-like protein
LLLIPRLGGIVCSGGLELLIISDEVKKVYPEALLGILTIRNVCNPKKHEELDRCKLELENSLRERYAGLDKTYLKNMEPIKTYNDYYKRFKKTYQVLLQLESIVFKNKSIPKVASLVEAMFMAELKNLLLTAGHDLDAIDLPIKLDVASGGEKYIQISSQEKDLIHNDMMVSDLQGITSSIIYGPDKRTQIKPDTRNVLFVVYAPPGIEKSKVFQHLQDIQNYVHIITPKSEVELLKVYEGKD